MIRIPKAVYERMIVHAKAGYPNEACGILGGEPGSAKDFYPMRNLDESPISYFMDPKEQLLVLKRMREDGVQMCGIFHSHVNSEAYPSQKDVRLAFYPDPGPQKEYLSIFPEASYLIVSLSDLERPVLRSFRIQQETVTEEEIHLV